MVFAFVVYVRIAEAVLAGIGLALAGYGMDLTGPSCVIAY